MRPRLLLSLLFALGVAACGGDDPADDDGGTGGSGGSGSGGTCTAAVVQSCTQFDPDGAPSECLEVDDASAQMIIDACAADEGAMVSTDPCDRTGSQGGCRTMIGSTCQIVWDYDAASADNYKQTCETLLGGTYVPAP